MISILFNLKVILKLSFKSSSMKNTLFILAFFTLLFCKKPAEVEKVTGEITDTMSIVFEENEVIPIENNIQEKEENDFEILLPSRYRDWENANAADVLNQSWIELYEKNGKYFLGQADYKITRGFDECSGDSTKTIETKKKTLILLQENQLKLGEIETVAFVKNKIWPTEKMTFSFNQVNYTLRAEGNVLSSENVSTDDGTEVYKNVEKYRLYISAGKGPEHLFLKQESFNDTFVEILFIGDIDRDGKPDFIFGANRDYEEERVILYLSSEAGVGKVIKKVAEIAVQFDC